MDDQAMTSILLAPKWVEGEQKRNFYFAVDL